MSEETAAVSIETEKKTDNGAPSTSMEQADGEDVDCEAKKLIGAGQRNLVMKDVRTAVCSFQEASRLLAKKYGDTADECADAFYLYGMSLLEMARLENDVLGNALEGMPEDEEDSDKEEDPNIPNAENLDENEREHLRQQVYDAMAEDESTKKQTPTTEKNGTPEDKENDANNKGSPKDQEKHGLDEQNQHKGESVDEKVNGNTEAGDKVKDEVENTDMKVSEKTEENVEGTLLETSKAAESNEDAKNEPASTKLVDEENKDQADSKSNTKETANESPDSTDIAQEESPDAEEKVESEASAKTESKDTPSEKESKPEADDKMDVQEQMEGEGEEDDSEENEGTEEKENEEEDVGNLQLAWELLDLAKIIFKRQKSKEAQLKASQTHLKLGEVCIESENYTQAVEDFLACLNIQKEHLEEHDRLLAETHYQLGLAYQYSSKHKEAISHFTQSVGVIEKRMDLLTKQIETVKGESSENVQKEMDELKDLLPDIKEKIEDSKEAQKNESATKIALEETLVSKVAGSSGFSQENGSTSFATSVDKSEDCAVPVTNCVSDISHLVRKKVGPGTNLLQAPILEV
ncbi:hypothetical protein GDO86_007934 [Hymenochirus boettgeri]|uniref:Tetratricopeptide SHNi-TPR domain-containing protein n=1 Tax=Hymenochirus boettgeri TaxID=247094 RepID=A0A8T2J152_9PIPI|nr:hypothetical protein GDO86_007934 [Hymenochirus boettgeri]